MYFWQQMNIDIENFIRRCRTCEKYALANFKENLKPHKGPEDRMAKIGMDILEYGGRAYLVIVDYFSQWIDVYPLQNKSRKEVIEAMIHMFEYTGYPVNM